MLFSADFYNKYNKNKGWHMYPDNKKITTVWKTDTRTRKKYEK